MSKTVKFEGTTHQFPDDATDDEIRSALESAHPDPKAKEPFADYQPMSVGEKVGMAAKQLGSAIDPRGLINAGGTVLEFLKNPAEWARQHFDASKAQVAPGAMGSDPVNEAAAGLVPIAVGVAAGDVAKGVKMAVKTPGVLPTALGVGATVSGHPYVGIPLAASGIADLADHLEKPPVTPAAPVEAPRVQSAYSKNAPVRPPLAEPNPPLPEQPSKLYHLFERDHPLSKQGPVRPPLADVPRETSGVKNSVNIMDTPAEPPVIPRAELAELPAKLVKPYLSEPWKLTESDPIFKELTPERQAQWREYWDAGSPGGEGLWKMQAVKQIRELAGKTGGPTGGVVSPAGAEVPQPVQSPAQQKQVTTRGKGMSQVNKDAGKLIDQAAKWEFSPKEVRGMDEKGWAKLAFDAGVPARTGAELANMKQRVWMGLANKLAGPAKSGTQLMDELKASLPKEKP